MFVYTIEKEYVLWLHNFAVSRICEFGLFHFPINSEDSR